MSTWEHEVTEDVLKYIPVNSGGYGVIPKLIMQDKRLHISAKAVYAYFASYTGGGDTCFPSRKKICYDLNISGETLGKYLKQLADCGYITIEQEKVNGRFSHNIYTICGSILPCTENSDTENSDIGKMDTNNNIYKNNSISNINSNKNIGHARFQPPSFEEVKAYCIERRNTVDPQRFIDYYESNGWKVGKNPMKDWKAAVRTWERNGYSNNSASKNQMDEPGAYDFDYDEIRKEFL